MRTDRRPHFRIESKHGSFNTRERNSALLKLGCEIFYLGIRLKQTALQSASTLDDTSDDTIVAGRTVETRQTNSCGFCDRFCAHR